MPRRSAEDARRHARAPAADLPPPPHLSRASAATWQAIIAARPEGTFDPGNLPLLAMYCHAAEMARGLGELMTATPVDDPRAGAIEARHARMAAHLGMLAKALRLTVQARIDRRSRMLDEVGEGEEAAADPLLGGKVVAAGRPKRA